MLERLGTSYNKNQQGTLRTISQQSLDELQKIFDETGGTRRLEKIEKDSAEKAKDLNIDFKEGKDDYFKWLYNE